MVMLLSKCTISVVLAFVVFLSTQFAHAQSRSPGEAKPKSHFLDGHKHYQAGRYEDAIAAFAKAQGICPTVAMLYNLGRAHDMAGHPNEALSFFEEFLAQKPGTPEVKAVKARVKEIKAKKKAKKALPELDWEDPFKPMAETSKKAKATPKPLPEDALASQPEPEAPGRPWYKRPWAWVATGVGVGLIATGSALLATRRVDQWQRNEETGKLESVTDHWWPGAVLAGVGAVAGGVGVWLFVREDGEVQEGEQASTVTLGVRPSGTGMSLMGTF